MNSTGRSNDNPSAASRSDATALDLPGMWMETMMTWDDPIAWTEKAAAMLRVVGTKVDFDVGEPLPWFLERQAGERK